MRISPYLSEGIQGQTRERKIIIEKVCLSLEKTPGIFQKVKNESRK
jgi:hypothetical protein